MSPNVPVRCVLTGATGGIGRALAGELAGRGAKLILCGRSPSTLAALARELPTGSVLGSYAGDLRCAESRLRLCDLAAEQRANMLVNLCGVNDLTLLEAQSDESVAALVEANLLVPIELTRLMLGALQLHPESWVVNVGSVLGAIGQPGYAVYCATKFGLRGFSEALRRELADKPVHVVYVAPRATRTAMNDAVAEALNDALGNTVDDPAAVARRIADAAFSARAAVTVGVLERLFSGLNGLAPWLVDRAMKSKLASTRKIIGAGRAAKEKQHVEVMDPNIGSPDPLGRFRNGTG